MSDSRQDGTVAVLEVPGAGSPAGMPDDALVEADELVEEISIDGMCGVY